MAITFAECIQNQRCFLCGRGAQLTAGDDGYFVECRACGRFHFPSSMLATVKDDEKDLLRYLSVYTRQQSDQEQKTSLNAMNWKETAVAYKNTPISSKARKLLELIGVRSRPGHPVTFDPNTDPPLVGAGDPNELNFLLQHLKEIGNLDPTGQNWGYLLKPKGWQELESTKTQGGVPGKCFVAMSFDKSLTDPYESGIFSAVKSDCKMESVRVDRVHHNEKICDKIIAEIRTCQFLIADVTLQRAGVYFEAGFAIGLGRPVIWSCREDDLKNVHFDTRQYNHIVWNAPSDLRTQLTDRIRATIRGAV